VSTRPEAELAGPRSHVLGVINGYESLGWEVTPYIVGDRVPLSWVTPGSEEVARGHWLKTLAIDLLRLGMGGYHALRAGAEIRGPVDWVYERGALLQAMGWVFQQRGIPWVLETNSLQWKEAAEDRDSLVLERIARQIEFASYHACDVLVTVSTALRDLLVERGVDPAKVVVVPNGVDVSAFDPDDPSPPSPSHSADEAFTVGFVGALSEWQALPLLFQAVADLREEGLNIGVTVVGDGHARAEWERAARQLGVESHVHFEGRQPHHRVPKYIADFDVGYSGPARLGTGNMYMSPLKLYEYLAMETPILAAAYEDARRLVDESGGGFLFEPENIDALKRALRDAYQERGEALRRRGRDGRELVGAKHSWEARIRRLNRKVRDITGTRPVTVPP
jgi:glycosyltransferase involved in cell wall biosynthesis